MALGKDAFVEGDVGLGSEIFEVWMKIPTLDDETGKITPGKDYELACLTETSEEFNEDTVEWQTLCGNGNKNSRPGASSYDIPIKFKQTKKGLDEKIYRLRFNKTARANIPTIVYNALYDISTSFVGSLNMDTADYTVDDLAEIGGTVTAKGTPVQEDGFAINIPLEMVTDLDTAQSPVSEAGTALTNMELKTLFGADGKGGQAPYAITSDASSITDWSTASTGNEIIFTVEDAVGNTATKTVTLDLV